jgi:hypothetical protein
VIERDEVIATTWGYEFDGEWNEVARMTNPKTEDQACWVDEDQYLLALMRGMGI